MRKWTRVLPYFIVRWYARRYLERVRMGGAFFAQPYKDTLIFCGRVDDDPPVK